MSVVAPWHRPTLRVVERELRVYRRLWRSSAFTTFGFPVLFLAALGIGVGGLVEEGTGQVEGLDYLDFVTPGMFAASVLLSAAGRSMWPVIAGKLPASSGKLASCRSRSTPRMWSR